MCSGWEVPSVCNGRALRATAPEIAAANVFIAAAMVFDQFTDARCRLLGLAMFGHAGAIRIAPVVGEAAAGV